MTIFIWSSLFGTQGRTALSRAHPSAKAADIAILLLLNKHLVIHPLMRRMAVPPLNC